MSVIYSGVQLRRSRELLTRLTAALHAARFYPMAHPAVVELTGGLFRTIEAYFDEGVDVALTFVDGEALLGEQVLAEESIMFDQLIRSITRSGAGSVTFRRGLTARELGRAVEVLSMPAEEIEECGGLGTLLQAAELPNVAISAVAALDQVDEATLVQIEDRAAARLAYDRALDTLRAIDRALKGENPLPAAAIGGSVDALVDNILMNRVATLELAALKDYDEYTYFHSVNTAVLAVALGTGISRDRRFLAGLCTAALLHDIGKLLIDVDIVRKEGPLTADEWAEMRQHPVYGAEQVARLGGLDRSAIVAVYEHHQRLDGSGYPPATPGVLQHLDSRIIAIADTYDAVTSPRSYSAARLPDEAVGMLVQGAGASYDAGLVRLFVRAIGVYPARSLVRLSDGELAVVLEADPESPLLPVVNVFAAADGALYEEPSRVELAGSAGRGRSVACCLDPRVAGIDVEDYL